MPKGLPALVLNDIHFPNQDEGLLRAVCAWADSHLPDRFGVILNGDIFDCHGLSTHHRDLVKWAGDGGLAGDVRAASKWFLPWVSAAEWACFLPGNHEARVWRIIESTPALAGITSPAAAFGLAEYGIKCLDRYGYVDVGGTGRVEHGDSLFAGRGAGNPAVKALANVGAGRWLAFGHFHRAETATATKTAANGQRLVAKAASLGHLSTIASHLSYAGRYPNWQHGFGVISWEGNLPVLQSYVIERPTPRTTRITPL